MDDIGSVLSWRSLKSFIFHLPPESAIRREINPEVYEWSTRQKTNAILADIYDILAVINSNLVAVGSHKRQKRPKPYPRPGQKEPENIRKIGKGAVSHDELIAFFEKKRAEHGRKCTGSRTGDSDDHSLDGGSTENNI